jgi:hypothetical protein
VTKIKRKIHDFSYKESFIIKYNWEHLNSVLQLDSEDVVPTEWTVKQPFPSQFRPKDQLKYVACLADQTPLGISIKQNRILHFADSILDMSLVKPRFEILPDCNDDFSAKEYDSELSVLSSVYDERVQNPTSLTKIWDLGKKAVLEKIPLVVYDLQAASMSNNEVVTVKKVPDGIFVELWQVGNTALPLWCYFIPPQQESGLSVVFRNGFVAVLIEREYESSYFIILTSKGELVKTMDCGFSASNRSISVQMTDFHLVAVFHSKQLSKILIYNIPGFEDPILVELHKQDFELQTYLPFGISISENSQFLCLNNMKAHTVDSKVVGRTSILFVYDLLEFSKKKFVIHSPEKRLVRNGETGSKNCWCVAKKRGKSKLFTSRKTDVLSSIGQKLIIV